MLTTSHTLVLRRLTPMLRMLLGIAVATGTAAPAGAQVPSAPVSRATPAQMVDAFNSIFGAQPLTRANHANGFVLKAVFTPDPAAAKLTKAVHFQSAATPVLLRFSNFGGNPHIGDADPGAAPYGMSLKFSLPDGSETDLVLHSFNGFPARTVDEFREFLLAMGKSPAGSAHPTALESLAAGHQCAKSFLDTPKAPPVSFTSQPYFGVNTFKFTNARGQVNYGRYRFVPVDGARYLGSGRSATAAGDYLRTEILHRIAVAPVSMRLQVQLAEAGDALDNPCIAWPERRELVELGSLSIIAAVPDSRGMEEKLVFFPDELPEGIEAQDPMLKARTKAYSESFDRRQR
jgi:catalase